jgi:predicted GIY-YIG superfamily endonuclease
MKTKDTLLPLEERQTTLYRVYDVDGLLLYVGITCDYKTRMYHHERYAKWWRDASDFRTEVFSNRRLARTAEWKAIRSEDPTANCHEKLAERRYYDSDHGFPY